MPTPPDGLSSPKTAPLTHLSDKSQFPPDTCSPTHALPALAGRYDDENLISLSGRLHREGQICRPFQQGTIIHRHVGHAQQREHKRVTARGNATPTVGNDPLAAEGPHGLKLRPQLCRREIRVTDWVDERNGWDIDTRRDVTGTPAPYRAPRMILDRQRVEETRLTVPYRRQHFVFVGQQFWAQPCHEAGRRILTWIRGDGAPFQRPFVPAPVQDGGLLKPVHAQHPPDTGGPHMRPQIAARVIEDDVGALPNAIAGHGVRKLRGRGHHEGQGTVTV